MSSAQFTTSLDTTTSRIVSDTGTVVGFQSWGEGQPLVLVHGAFSPQRPGWKNVRELLGLRARCHAISRRGRGATHATSTHDLEDEIADAIAVIRHIGEPVALLGHSYGALVALGAARVLPTRVRRLVLYEAPRPSLIDAAVLSHLERIAEMGEWEEFAISFFCDVLSVSRDDLEAVRDTEDWADVVLDGNASLMDLRALKAFRFDPESYLGVSMPVLLQYGTESPAENYLTEALATVLEKARLGPLAGSGHDAMVTAPERYAGAVLQFIAKACSDDPAHT